MKDEDDSGDEAEARHLLEKRREQAKYDAVQRGDTSAEYRGDIRYRSDSDESDSDGDSG